MLRSSVVETMEAAARTHGVDLVIESTTIPDSGASLADALYVGLTIVAAERGEVVYLSRRHVPDEGPDGTMLSFASDGSALRPAHARRVKAFVAAGARVTRREAAMRPHVSSGFAPAWGYLMHRAALLVVSHSAGGLPLAFVPIVDNQVKENRRGSGRRELSSGRAMTVVPADFAGRYGRSVVEARADRVFAHDLEIGRRPDNSPLAIFRDRAEPEILVTGLQLPRTVLAAMPGTDLARVVDHPAFGDHAGIPVLGATNDEDIGGVVLRLPTILDPAGPAPEGVDLSWRPI